MISIEEILKKRREIIGDDTEDDYVNISSRSTSPEADISSFQMIDSTNNGLSISTNLENVRSINSSQSENVRSINSSQSENVRSINSSQSENVTSPFSIDSCSLNQNVTSPFSIDSCSLNQNVTSPFSIDSISSGVSYNPFDVDLEGSTVSFNPFEDNSTTLRRSLSGSQNLIQRRPDTTCFNSTTYDPNLFPPPQINRRVSYLYNNPVFDVNYPVNREYSERINRISKKKLYLGILGGVTTVISLLIINDYLLIHGKI